MPSQTLAALPTGLTAPIFTLTAPTGSLLRARAGARHGRSERDVERNPAPRRRAGGAVGADGAAGDGQRQHAAPGVAADLRRRRGDGALLDVTGSVSASLPLPAGERVSFAGVPSGTYTVAMRSVPTPAATARPRARSPSRCRASARPRQPPRPTCWPTSAAARRSSSGIRRPAAMRPPGTSSTVPGIGAFPVSTRTISGPLPAGTYTIDVRSAGACAIERAGDSAAHRAVEDRRPRAPATSTVRADRAPRQPRRGALVAYSDSRRRSSADPSTPVTSSAVKSPPRITNMCAPFCCRWPTACRTIRDGDVAGSGGVTVG